MNKAKKTFREVVFSKTVIVGVLLLIQLAMLLVFTSLKCPYCGKQLFSKCLTVTVCPNCKRNLTTGMKSKGKKK